MWYMAGYGRSTAYATSRDGKVVAPFSLENSARTTTDTTRVAVKWKGAEDLASLAGKPLRFRFHLTNGALYAFWASPGANGERIGYAGAGGHGFINGRDEGTSAKP